MKLPIGTCTFSLGCLLRDKRQTKVGPQRTPFGRGFSTTIPTDVLRYGVVLAISDDFWGYFPRVLATWYHFSGNFHRYVLSFRLGVPIPDPFLEDAAMASPKRRAGAVFGVGNTSQVYQPYTNIVALFKGYNSVLFSA